jgi:hypothetical protein
VKVLLVQHAAKSVMDSLVVTLDVQYASVIHTSDFICALVPHALVV